MSTADSPPTVRRGKPFRGAVFRGLTVVLPPLLTVVILVWIGQTLTRYVLEPISSGTRDVLAYYLADVRKTLPDAEPTADDATVWVSHGARFKKLVHGSNEEFVPLDVYATVERELGRAKTPDTGRAVYQRYVEIEYLRPYYVVPVVAVLFIVVMYLLGSVFAAGLGRMSWNLLERGISRLPVVRGVYSAVKQVTDYMLSENELEFSRVVAVEYPCKGTWTLAFVTGEGMAAVAAAMGEPMLSVMFPTLPMPITGNTRMVPKSQALDLDFTIEQACQYILSFGVIVPPHQLPAMAAPHAREKIGK